MPVPAQPKIYHITHIDNLAGMLDRVAWSDSERIERGLECAVVGMSNIKRRRLEELDVDCHRGTKVGEYVPFYFCPRSIMLYILHMGDSPDLTYRGGQRPIVHLQADLNSVFAWAAANKRRWAISNGNAGAYYTSFSSSKTALDDLNWQAIATNNWRDPDVKEAKQSEFLVFESFPWALIELIGVIDRATADKVSTIIGGARHRPRVEINSAWYY